MENISVNRCRNRLIAVVVLSVVFSFTVGTFCGFYYKEYRLANIGLYDKKDVAERTILHSISSVKNTKLLKKITDGNNEKFLVIRPKIDFLTGVQVYELNEETNRFLLFSNSGFRVNYGMEHRVKTDSDIIGKTESGIFYYITFSQSVLQETEYLKDYLSSEYTKSDIAIEKQNNNFKMTITEENGNKKNVDLEVGESEFNGKKIRFIFVKLP